MSRLFDEMPEELKMLLGIGGISPTDLTGEKEKTREEDFDYYKKIDGKDLRECSDNEALIGCIFDNVFSPSHHLYKVVKRKDG